MANLKDLIVNGTTRLIGNVYATTPVVGTSDTQVATTAFVQNANSGKMDKAPAITTLTAGTSVSLEDNSINRITIDTATTFVLPTNTDNTKLSQILVQINLTSVVAIDVGTTMFFNSEAPDLSTTGNYNLIYEYDGTDWVCGSLTKGAVS